MWAVFNKEITSFFSSLVAYIAIALFLLILALFLWVFPDTSIPDYGYASMSTFFTLTPLLLMLLIPAVTMKAFAEEKKEGTFELLLTLPLTEWQIIAGKFFASLAVIAAALVPTLIWYLSVYFLGNPIGNVDSGAVIGSYLGLLLLAGSFTAVGIFCSSVTSNQILAFVLSLAVIFLFFMGFDYVSALPVLAAVDYYVAGLGFNAHYQSLGRGVADSRDLIYFISMILLFLLATRMVIGGRKW